MIAEDETQLCNLSMIDVLMAYGVPLGVVTQEMWPRDALNSLLQFMMCRDHSGRTFNVCLRNRYLLPRNI